MSTRRSVPTMEPITARRRRILRALLKSVRDNTPRIEQKLARNGRKPDPAVVFSVAKYYRALSKLAKE